MIANPPTRRGPAGPAGVMSASEPLVLSGSALSMNTFAARELFLNPNRVDAYAEDGSVLRPFKTWSAAHAYAVANNIGVVKFKFQGAGSLNEVISLNWSGFSRVIIDGGDGWDVNPTVGTVSFDCTQNNDTLDILRVIGLWFYKDVQLIGATSAQGLGTDECTFRSCSFNAITVKNVFQCTFGDCTISGNQVFENIGGGLLSISGGNGIAPGTMMTVTTNLANPHGPAFSQTLVIVEKTIAGSDATVDAGSFLQYREGCRIGYPGGTITNAGMLQAYNSFFRSNVVNTGTFVDRFNGFNGSISGAGSHVVDGGPSYIPTTATDWSGTAPQTLQSALDRIAAALNALGHKP